MLTKIKRRIAINTKRKNPTITPTMIPIFAPCEIPSVGLIMAPGLGDVDSTVVLLAVVEDDNSEIVSVDDGVEPLDGRIDCVDEDDDDDEEDCMSSNKTTTSREKFLLFI